jgi:hypothetical protein
VYAPYQWTRRIDHIEAARGCIGLDPSGDAMRTEYGDRAGRHLIDLVDKHRTLFNEPGHHLLVVHDVMAHIDWRTMQLKRTLDNVDSAHDPGAEPAWPRQDDTEGLQIVWHFNPYHGPEAALRSISCGQRAMCA